MKRKQRILKELDELIKLHKDSNNKYTYNKLEVIKKGVVASRL